MCRRIQPVGVPVAAPAAAPAGAPAGAFAAAPTVPHNVPLPEMFAGMTIGAPQPPQAAQPQQPLPELPPLQAPPTGAGFGVGDSEDLARSALQLALKAASDSADRAQYVAFIQRMEEGHTEQSVNSLKWLWAELRQARVGRMGGWGAKPVDVGTLRQQLVDALRSCPTARPTRHAVDPPVLAMIEQRKVTSSLRATFENFIATFGAARKLADRSAGVTVLPAGLVRVPIAADGNCAFAAFAYALQSQNTYVTAAELRDEFRAYCMTNQAELRAFFPTFDDDLRVLTGSGGWNRPLGDAVMPVLARLFHAHVRIYQQDLPPVHIMEAGARFHVDLVRVNGDHYDATRTEYTGALGELVAVLEADAATARTRHEAYRTACQTWKKGDKDEPNTQEWLARQLYFQPPFGPSDSLTAAQLKEHFPGTPLPNPEQKRMSYSCYRRAERYKYCNGPAKAKFAADAIVRFAATAEEANSNAKEDDTLRWAKKLPSAFAQRQREEDERLKHAPAEPPYQYEVDKPQWGRDARELRASLEREIVLANMDRLVFQLADLLPADAPITLNDPVGDGAAREPLLHDIIFRAAEYREDRRNAWWTGEVLAKQVLTEAMPFFDVHSLSAEGETALSMHCRKTRPPLLHVYEEFEHKSRYHVNGHFRAVHSWELFMAELLVKAGADCNTRDRDGHTPIHAWLSKVGELHEENQHRSSADGLILLLRHGAVLDRGALRSMLFAALRCSSQWTRDEHCAIWQLLEDPHARFALDTADYFSLNKEGQDVLSEWKAWADQREEEVEDSWASSVYYRLLEHRARWPVLRGAIHAALAQHCPFDLQVQLLILSFLDGHADAKTAAAAAAAPR